jgi:hypothetical protein
MLHPVVHINFGQFLGLDDQQILRILFLGSFHEVERSGYYRFLVKVNTASAIYKISQNMSKKSGTFLGEW